VSGNSGLAALVGGYHDPLNPFFDAGVGSMPRAREVLGAPAPSQMHFDNATIVKLKESIVGTAGMRNGCEPHTM
jgi:hypothetical protein